MKSWKDDQLEVRFDRDGIKALNVPDSFAEFYRLAERRMTRRKFAQMAALSAGGVLFGGALLTACGSSSSSGTTATASASGSAALPGEGKKIGYASNGWNEWNQSVITGCFKALEGTGYTLVVRQANFDPKMELSNLEALLSQGLAALNILPVTVESSSRGALNAKQAGVPCTNNWWAEHTAGDPAYIGVLRDGPFKTTQEAIPGQTVPPYMSEVGGGGLVADFIMKAVPGGGGWLFASGIAGQAWSDQLEKGLKDSFTPEYPMLERLYTNFVRSTAIDVTQTMLTAHPDAKAIVSCGASAGAGIATLLKKLKKTDIVHVTNDMCQETSDQMKAGPQEGQMAARYDSPAQNGIWVVSTIRNYLEQGTKPEFITLLPCQMITCANPPQVVADLGLTAADPASPAGVLNASLEPSGEPLPFGNTPTGVAGTFEYMEYVDQMKASVGA